MLAGVTPFGLHRLPVIYRAFGTDYANNYIIAFFFLLPSVSNFGIVKVIRKKVDYF